MGSVAPSDDGELAVGDVLDNRYRIEAVIGTGGMGRVYRAEHTGIGRPVAIKVLHAELSSREASERFKREAKASGRLDHPNIVAVSDFGVVERGPCYLVMEALEGESLGARLERERRIPWAQAVSIVRELLQGLRHAHDRGVVHRDIKPDNVFLASKEGEVVVKILDFGIAKLYAGSPDDPASTRAGLTVGTPAYLSPEQAVGGEIKPASDLYSTSIVLFEMITGRTPFEDPDPLAMLGAHVSRPPPRMTEVAPGLELPGGLEEIVQRGLAKSSSERFASAADYLAALDSIGSSTDSGLSFLGQPIAGPSPGRPSSLTPVPGITTLPASGPIGAPIQTFPDATSVTPLPVAARTMTIADAPPLPRRWIKLGVAIVAAVVIVLGLALALGGDDEGGGPMVHTKVDLPMITADDGTRLKALIHDLENAKTCPERREAVVGLAALGNADAVPALKRARYRMRGGVLGIGDSNTNACLKKDAEAAIKALGGSLR